MVYQVVQFIENQFIYPHVVGSSVGLEPLWTIIAVLVGGAAFGILGMIFFIPVMAVVYTLLKETVTPASSAGRPPCRPRRWTPSSRTRSKPRKKQAGRTDLHRCNKSQISKNTPQSQSPAACFVWESVFRRAVRGRLSGRSHRRVLSSPQWSPA